MQRVRLVRSVVAVGAVFAMAAGRGVDDGDTLTTPWEATSAEGNEVTLRVFTGSVDCGELGRIETTETDVTVEIHAYIHEIGGGTCAALAGEAQASVTLDAPLGNRTLTGCDPEGTQQWGFRRQIEDGCRGFS